MAQAGDPNRRTALLAAAEVMGGRQLDLDVAGAETLVLAEQFLVWLDDDQPPAT